MEWYQRAYGQAIEKVVRTSRRIQSNIPYCSRDGVYNDQTFDAGWWTNGFWSGILWYAWKQTGEERLLGYIRGCESILDTVLENYDRMDHDAGFMWQPSACADYTATGDDLARRRALHAAATLASRFNLKGGFLRAWNDRTDGTDRRGWAIIDCMMNLPILYWASEISGDPRFRYIAEAHADTTMRRFIRPDGSVRHIVEFDPFTGECTGSQGGQGYDVDSSWSRGTAWALYGFTMSYHYTGRQEYLDCAKRIAHFFIAALPEDRVPFADFAAPAEVNIHKDTSAGACGASGLLWLSKLVPENQSAIYRNAGMAIVEALDRNHAAWGENEEALLKNGCVSFHHQKDFDIPLIYGDYFFVEALAQLNGKKPLFAINADDRG